jgi:hypothetical protein
MKTLLAATFAALTLALAVPAHAQFRVLSTPWNAPGGFTNVINVVTNLGSSASGGVVTATKVKSFDLDFLLGFTNACAGTYDVRWDTSNDATNWTVTTAASSARGFFSIPLTNAGAAVAWRTNIPIADAGYLRLSFGTNQSGQSLTSAVVRAYAKD